MTDTKPDAEPCTTQSRRARHYSTNLKGDPSVPGRSGWTLCGYSAGDEERANRWSDRRAILANLPECKLCLKSVAKLERAG